MECLTNRLLLAALALLSASGLQGADVPATEEADDHELAPGVRIERADPGRHAESRRRLSIWRELYGKRLEPLRAEVARLFSALERSSLMASAVHCDRISRSVSEVGRQGLFSSSEPRLDRVLFGSLERFEAGSSACLAGRYVEAFRLLQEAWAGLGWIDRHLESRLRPRIPLPGLGAPERPRPDT